MGLKDHSGLSSYGTVLLFSTYRLHSQCSASAGGGGRSGVNLGRVLAWAFDTKKKKKKGANRGQIVGEQQQCFQKSGVCLYMYILGIGLLIPRRETRNEEFHDEEFLARKRRRGKNEE